MHDAEEQMHDREGQIHDEFRLPRENAGHVHNFVFFQAKIKAVLGNASPSLQFFLKNTLFSNS